MFQLFSFATIVNSKDHIVTKCLRNSLRDIHRTRGAQFHCWLRSFGRDSVPNHLHLHWEEGRKSVPQFPEIQNFIFLSITLFVSQSTFAHKIKVPIKVCSTSTFVQIKIKSKCLFQHFTLKPIFIKKIVNHQNMITRR